MVLSYLECARWSQCSETPEREATFSGSCLRCQNIGYTVQLFLFPRRIWNLGSLTLLFCAETVGGGLAHVCMLAQTAVWFSAASSHLEHRGPVSTLRQSQSLGQSLEKLEHQLHGPTLPFPREKMRSGGFHPLALCWAGGRTMASVYMLFNHYLCFQRFLIWDPFLSVLRFRQGRNQSLRHPLQNSECWTSGPVLFLPSQGESGG